MLNRPNVILITADSLRADRLSGYGYARPTSPNLDRFAETAVRFTHAFSNGPNTAHAFPAIFSGLHPLTYSRLGLFDAPLTLSEALRCAGFTTIGFNAANPYVSRIFKYDRGFDEFYDYMDGAESWTDDSNSTQGEERVRVPQMAMDQYLLSQDSVHRKASLENEMNYRIFERVGTSSRPFFLWAHYMDTHYPYLPLLEPQKELGIEPIGRDENFEINSRVRENMPLSPSRLQKVQDLYDAAVRQLDSKLGELFRFLQQRDLFDSSLIVFCADHGEEFFEHGDLQHKSKLFDELLRVPLLIKRPFASRALHRDELVSLIQLPSTICSLLELVHPFEAPSLFSSSHHFQDRENYIFAEASYAPNGGPPVDRQIFNIDPLPKRFAYRDLFWKVIVDTEEKPVFYHLVSDPFEKAPLFELSEAPQMAILQEHIRTQEQQRLLKRVSRARKKLISVLAESTSFILILTMFMVC